MRKEQELEAVRLKAKRDAARFRANQTTVVRQGGAGGIAISIPFIPTRKTPNSPTSHIQRRRAYLCHLNSMAARIAGVLPRGGRMLPMCVCACVRVCVCVRARACVRACVCVCVLSVCGAQPRGGRVLPVSVTAKRQASLLHMHVSTK